MSLQTHVPETCASTNFATSAVVSVEIPINIPTEINYVRVTFNYYIRTKSECKYKNMTLQIYPAKQKFPNKITETFCYYKKKPEEELLRPFTVLNNRYKPTT